MANESIGAMFPAGGPVPPELVIGRERDVEDLVMLADENVHVLLTGPRRIGKTTVCGAVCARASDDGALVLKVEVPERVDSRDLLQMIIDSCSRASLQDEIRGALRTAKPFIEKFLKSQDVPLDLSGLGREPESLAVRAVLELPHSLAAETGRRVVVFLDELQRVVDYSDGARLLIDLVDIYSTPGEVSLLVDGSDRRAIDGMHGPPVHFGKLCRPIELDEKIDVSTWRVPLTDRFTRVGLVVRPHALEELLAFGAGRPYQTMLACRHAALTARRTGGDTVDSFDAAQGIDAAIKQLGADGA